MPRDLIYVDAKGDKKPVDLSLDMYKEAAAAGQSVPQYLATTYPTNASRDGTAFEQVMEQCNIFVKGDKKFGLKPSTVGDVVAPSKDAAVTREGVPASRLMFPAVMLEIIENKLNVDMTTNPNALTSMLAVDGSINGERFERPVLNFSRPEGARSAPVAQLGMPRSMLSITVSDKAQRIPTWGLGMEISEQAQRSTTLDLVGLAVSRQAEVEANERANTAINALLVGDSDMGQLALSSISNKVVTSQTMNGGVALGAGILSQKAWIKWLSRNSSKRVISHIITDIDGALMIENRTGKPVIVGDNPNSVRIDTLMQVMNAKWAANVQVFITDDPNWPANTMMGIDKRYAIARQKSLTAAYSAIEDFAMRRSTMLRIDSGDMTYRLFDEAFEVMTTAT